MKQRGKKKKRNEDNLRDLWDNVKCPNIQIMGVPGEKKQQQQTNKKKGHEKILKELLFENFPKMGKEIATQVQKNTESPKQDKSNAKHPKTHINQINKDQTQRTNIKSSKGKTTNNIRGFP